MIMVTMAGWWLTCDPRRRRGDGGPRRGERGATGGEEEKGGRRSEKERGGAVLGRQPLRSHGEHEAVNEEGPRFASRPGSAWRLLCWTWAAFWDGGDKFFFSPSS